MPSLCWWMAGLFREVSGSPLGPPALLDFVLVSGCQCQWWPGCRTWRAELACRAGRPGESHGWRHSEHFPNIFRTFSEHCQTLSGELPAPGRGRGGGTHQFRTFSEHFPNMCRLVLSLRSPSEPGHPPAPNIFRTFSGHYRGIPLPGRELGNSVQTPRRATLPQPRQSPRQACPEHTSASFNIGGLAGGLVDGPAGPARRFAALAGWLAGWPARYPSSFWLPNVSREVVK